MIIPYEQRSPQLGSGIFIAPDAWVIGNVSLADQVSVFFGAVLRGDLEPILIGARSNIQELSVLHTTHDRSPVTVGCDVTVGHRATLHSCTVKDRCIIGMGAIILDEAVIGEDCLVAAGALITQGKVFPPRSLVLGAPARVVRELSAEEVAGLLDSARRYVKVGQSYLANTKLRNI